MKKMTGKNGSRSMAFALMIEKGHNIDSLIAADKYVQALDNAQTPNIRRFFRVDDSKMTKVGGKMVKRKGKTVHVGGVLRPMQKVVGCLCAWKNGSGEVVIGHSMCHPHDHTIADKQIGSVIADLQAGLQVVSVGDAIPAHFNMEHLEDFMERCVKYFRIPSVSATVWTHDDSGKSVQATIEMTAKDVEARVKARKGTAKVDKKATKATKVPAVEMAG